VLEVGKEVKYRIMEITKVPSGGMENETLALRFGFIQPNVSRLEGRILTIIDASEDGEKRDAVKDLVKREFRETLEWFNEITHTDLSRAKEIYPKKWGRPFPELTVKVI
jgi:hypothetical protein